MAHTFTLEEANAVVEVIRPLITQLMQVRQVIMEKQPAAWPILEKAAGNGGGRVASEIAFEFNQLDALVRKIQATGAELKDINTGLVDFRALREGREIYLCWKYGEDSIHFWHELDGGFAGRQPV